MFEIVLLSSEMEGLIVPTFVLNLLAGIGITIKLFTEYDTR
jgi:hypothetical protein